MRFVNRSSQPRSGPREAALALVRLQSIFEASRWRRPGADRGLGAGRGARARRGLGPTTPRAAQKVLELRGSRIEYRGRPAAECLLVDTTEAKRCASASPRPRSSARSASSRAGSRTTSTTCSGRSSAARSSCGGAASTREVDDELAVIEKAAHDGRETVRRIQEFSRTRRDKRFEPVNLPEMLRDAVEITKTRWKADAQSRNIAIESGSTPGPCRRSWETPPSCARSSPT